MIAVCNVEVKKSEFFQLNVSLQTWRQLKIMFYKYVPTIIGNEKWSNIVKCNWRKIRTI